MQVVVAEVQLSLFHPTPVQMGFDLDALAQEPSRVPAPIATSPMLPCPPPPASTYSKKEPKKSIKEHKAALAARIRACEVFTPTPWDIASIVKVLGPEYKQIEAAKARIAEIKEITKAQKLVVPADKKIGCDGKLFRMPSAATWGLLGIEVVNSRAFWLIWLAYRKQIVDISGEERTKAQMAKAKPKAEKPKVQPAKPAETAMSAAISVAIDKVVATRSEPKAAPKKSFGPEEAQARARALSQEAKKKNAEKRLHKNNQQPVAA